MAGPRATFAGASAVRSSAVRGNIPGQALSQRVSPHPAGAGLGRDGRLETPVSGVETDVHFDSSRPAGAVGAPPSDATSGNEAI
jgi:hypothetical protein